MGIRELLLTTALLGCNDAGGLLPAPSSDEGIQLAFKVTVQPGEENTICKNFAMPDGAFDIGRFEAAMTPVSHHLLVYNISLPSDQVTDELIDHCDENRDLQTSRVGILFGTQSDHSELQLPNGIAYPARGGLAVQLEYHVLNASDQPVDAEAALNLWRAKGDITGEAGMLFFYHTQIAIAPQSHGSARMRPTIASDLELMMLVPHMHSRGVAMEATHERVDGSREPLFSVDGWENPNQMFAPAVHIAANDIIDFRCDYENTTAEYIFDGFSARHDEMCVTGGVYYRPGGDRLPLTQEIAFGKGIVYTGTNSCTQIESCVAAIDFANTTLDPGHQFDLCVVAGCQTGATAFTSYDSCRWNQCRASCYLNPTSNGVDGFLFADPACVTCLDTNCAGVRDACSAATCQ